MSEPISGLIALIFGVAVAVAASRFPPTPGQNIGPGLFPMLIGGGVALGGLVLIFSGRRKQPVAVPEVDPSRASRESGGWLRAGLVIGALIFYALAVETVGFFLTAFAFLAALFLAFGVGRRWIVPLAAGVTLGLHVAFYSLLRVPLPWGWFEAIAW